MFITRIETISDTTCISYLAETLGNISFPKLLASIMTLLYLCELINDVMIC